VGVKEATEGELPPEPAPPVEVKPTGLVALIPLYSRTTARIPVLEAAFKVIIIEVAPAEAAF
jgi:hypothetical protein